MGAKTPGYGFRGPAGAAGAVGPAGATGPKGDAGATGPAGATGAIGATGAKGDTGATGPQGPQGSVGATGATGATGAAGSNASATPLGSATPKALGTATAGSATNAAREDHVHPLPAGNLQFLATASVGETGLLMLNLATKRYAVAVPGAALTDRLVVTLNGIPQNGILQDAYVSVAGTVSVGVLLPALGVAATVALPIAIYKVSV